MQTNEQLQGFTYSVAHDLRQQIRGISSNASMLLLDAAEVLDEENRSTLARLESNAKELGALIDDLLTYARLGKQYPTKNPTASTPSRASSTLQATFDLLDARSASFS